MDPLGAWMLFMTATMLAISGAIGLVGAVLWWPTFLQCFFMSQASQRPKN